MVEERGVTTLACVGQNRLNASRVQRCESGGSAAQGLKPAASPSREFAAGTHFPRREVSVTTRNALESLLTLIFGEPTPNSGTSKPETAPLSAQEIRAEHLNATSPSAPPPVLGPPNPDPKFPVYKLSPPRAEEG